MVSVPVNLRQFHDIIQTVMGWQNSHFFHFVISDIVYGPKILQEQDSSIHDFNVRLDALDLNPSAPLLYLYDFGDNWEHVIKLEQILEPDSSISCPTSLERETPCPPADGGGPRGSANMHDIAKDPEHENYWQIIEWLGDDFDPTLFNLKQVNRQLKRIKTNPPNKW